MKILLISARYLPHRGGLESVVYHLAREYSKRGHQVQIITNRYPRSLPVTEIIHGIKIIRLIFLLPEIKYIKRFRFDLWLAGFWYRWYTSRALQKIILKFNPDIIHNQYLNEVAEYTGLCLKKNFNLIPWIITFQGGDVDGEPLIDQANKERFQRFSQQAICLTACSAYLAKQVQTLQPALSGKIEVIHNGVNVDRFSTAQPSLAAQPYVFAVGQLVPHKGFELLIRAFMPLAKKYHSVQLWIAGDGIQRQSLEMIVRQNNLNQQVLFLGKVDESAVAALMADSLFVVMPSLREPFGIVALEGLAAGKPVLATPMGGLPEFLPVPPNRLVVPEIPAWETALDEWITMSLAGQLKADQNKQWASKFDWPIIADRYLQVYERAKNHI
ncbi:MAG TPA: glycosyltransferase family 4 protein [Anaerolineales bacterium]|nr:glycosyltransferase family 4 protein [Anaerolineales bacterium]